MCSCSIIDHWWPMGKIFHWLLMAVMVGLVSTQHNKVGPAREMHLLRNFN